MTNLSAEQDALFQRIALIIDGARTTVARSINTAMVHAYWLVGREIVEVEQGGAARAEYGEALVRALAHRLGERFGRGFSYSSVKRMKQFYLTFPTGTAIPILEAEKGSTPLSFSPKTTDKSPTSLGMPPASWKGSTPLSLSSAAISSPFPPLLSWSHYLVLIRVQDNQARSFYEIEAAREGWSVRELERQVASLLFERLAKSRNKDQLLALAKDGQSITEPRDVVKDPFVLEFLQLEERESWHERDLEQAIIERLEAFLLELGKGFCFVARQKRLTLEGDHFYVDLVCYNRLLRCFVLIDLKLGKLTHQDLGQMQMYVNYFDRYQRQEFEEPTVGIVLCSDKNDAMVKITLPEQNQQIQASRYQLYLPTEQELRNELERHRDEAERALQAAKDDVTTKGDE